MSNCQSHRNTNARHWSAPDADEQVWHQWTGHGPGYGDLKFAIVHADTQGLIPSIILSAAHTYSIVAIELDRAVLQTNGGATLMHRRHLPEERLAIPFWEYSAFRGPKQ